MSQGRLRTKTGCLVCRKRRVKCDEGRPDCGNCVATKRCCTWPVADQLVDRRWRRPCSERRIFNSWPQMSPRAAAGVESNTLSACPRNAPPLSTFTSYMELEAGLLRYFCDIHFRYSFYPAYQMISLSNVETDTSILPSAATVSRIPSLLAVRPTSMRLLATPDLRIFPCNTMERQSSTSTSQ